MGPTAASLTRTGRPNARLGDVLRRVVLPALLIPLLAAVPAAAEDVAWSDARLSRSIASPLHAERCRALDALLARGGAGRPLARAWTQDDSVHARVAGWTVLAQHGTEADFRAAVERVGDVQPTVAAAAARALLDLGGRLPPAEAARLPRGAAPGGTRTLGRALAGVLEGGPRDGYPPGLLALGEGLVPALAHVLEDPRYGTQARVGALRTLAAIGGTEARTTIGAFVGVLEGATGTAARSLWQAWWRAVNAVGCGAGLAPAQNLAVDLARVMDFNPWRGRIRRLHWRDRQQYFRFLAACPPAEGIAYVQGYLGWLIEQAAENARRRLFPSLAALVVKAYLVVSEPSEDLLHQAVLCARTSHRRHWQRRAEELGEVLTLLVPYRDRPGVQAGVKELLEEENLPKTVRAWALYLQGETDHDELVRIAEQLVDADGAAATLAQRRLGARLLGALGLPSAERIRKTAAAVDGTLHAFGLAWAEQAAAQGRMTRAEVDVLLAAALEVPDDTVFLVAAERCPAGLPEAARERLLGLALRAAPTVRGRAWRVVERSMDALDGTEGAFVAPGGHASLDVRLAAAGRARALWAR